MWEACALLIVQYNEAHFVAYDQLDKAFCTLHFGNYNQFFVKNVTDGTRTDFVQFTHWQKCYATHVYVLSADNTNFDVIQRCKLQNSRVGSAIVERGTISHTGYVIASLGSVIATVRSIIASWGPKSLTKKKLAVSEGSLKPQNRTKFRQKTQNRIGKSPKPQH